MTPERIAEIKARAPKATQGRWEAERDGDRVYVVAPGQRRYAVLQAIEPESEMEANALFAAHARQDIPDLLAALEQAQEREQYLAGLIRNARTQLFHGHVDAALYILACVDDAALQESGE